MEEARDGIKVAANAAMVRRVIILEFIIIFEFIISEILYSSASVSALSSGS
jgi:hypothetical protein